MIYTYSTILLASLVVALIGLFLYRIISGASKSILGSRETRLTRLPVGRQNHVRSRTLEKASPAMPTTRRGQDNVWPYREQKTNDIGTTHRVRRRIQSKGPVLEPWGW